MSRFAERTSKFVVFVMLANSVLCFCGAQMASAAETSETVVSGVMQQHDHSLPADCHDGTDGSGAHADGVCEDCSASATLTDINTKAAKAHKSGYVHIPVEELPSLAGYAAAVIRRLQQASPTPLPTRVSLRDLLLN